MILGIISIVCGVILIACCTAQLARMALGKGGDTTMWMLNGVAIVAATVIVINWSIVIANS